MINKIGPKFVSISLLVLLLLTYSAYQARFLILGPRVWITSHTNGEVIDSPVISLSGKALNISRISLNDRQIFTDEEGAWSEKLILSQGASIMTLKASDRFGREITKHIEIILN